MPFRRNTSRRQKIVYRSDATKKNVNRDTAWEMPVLVLARSTHAYGRELTSASDEPVSLLASADSVAGDDAHPGVSHHRAGDAASGLGRHGSTLEGGASRAEGRGEACKGAQHYHDYRISRKCVKPTKCITKRSSFRCLITLPSQPRPGWKHAAVPRCSSWICPSGRKAAQCPCYQVLWLLFLGRACLLQPVDQARSCVMLRQSLPHL